MIKQAEEYKSICEKDYYVGIRDMGQTNKITNKSILAFMENIAGYHASLLGLGFNDINTSHMSWVVLEWKLQIFSRPTYHSYIHLKTWPTHINKMYCYRDFEVYDENDTLCAIATSKWILFNVTTGTLVKSPNELFTNFKFHNHFVFGCEDIPKLRESKEEIQKTEEFTIRRSDIDLNTHVHNLNYIDFANNLLPEDIYFGQDELNNLEIVYKKEIKLEETVIASIIYESNKYIITLKDKSTNALHSIIRLYN